MSDNHGEPTTPSGATPGEILKAQSNTNPTYWAYLHLDQLLSCQNGIDSKEEDVSSDELHFIIVHQALELW